MTGPVSSRMGRLAAFDAFRCVRDVGSLCSAGATPPTLLLVALLLLEPGDGLVRLIA